MSLQRSIIIVNSGCTSNTAVMIRCIYIYIYTIYIILTYKTRCSLPTWKMLSYHVLPLQDISSCFKTKTSVFVLLKAVHEIATFHCQDLHKFALFAISLTGLTFFLGRCVSLVKHRRNKFCDEVRIAGMNIPVAKASHGHRTSVGKNSIDSYRTVGVCWSRCLANKT